MDTVITDVVSTTATKFQLDKKFFAGVAVGIAATGVAYGANKLRQKIAERREADVEVETL